MEKRSRGFKLPLRQEKVIYKKKDHFNLYTIFNTFQKNFNILPTLPTTQPSRFLFSWKEIPKNFYVFDRYQSFSFQTDPSNVCFFFLWNGLLRFFKFSVFPRLLLLNLPFSLFLEFQSFCTFLANFIFNLV